MQLRSGSSEIRSTAISLWLWRPGVETILGGCGHAPTGIDLNADAAVQSGRQMRRTRPRLPGPFLGTPTAAGLQEQPRRSFSQDGFEVKATARHASRLLPWLLPSTNAFSHSLAVSEEPEICLMLSAMRS